MAHATHHEPTSDREVRSTTVSKTTFFVGMVIVGLVTFVAGTRSDQLAAGVSALFGTKVSTDSIDTAVLQDAYRNLVANYDGTLDKAALADGAARGMIAAAGDRYTVFMDKKEAQEFSNDLSGQVSGVGCEIGVRSGQPTILRVLSDSPAEKAGLQVGDVFVSVNGVSVDGKDAASVAQKVRGDIGTSVKLTMKRGDGTQNFTITRAQVSDPSVRWSVRDGIGEMIISRFDDQTSDLAHKAAQEFKDKGVKAVILDLRDNGGGYLDAAVNVAGIWLDNKLVVSEKTGDKTTGEEKTSGATILSGMKTVVLVNGGTASASEILAGALQEHGAATLVGEKTFGKGSVQKVLQLTDGRVLKVTIAKWYTPKGKNITKEGITPQTEVKMTSEDVNTGKDPQIDKARELAG